MLGTELLRTAVTLYFRGSIIDRDIGILRDAGYRVLEVDTSNWVDVTIMHRDLATASNFLAHYGQNWRPWPTALGDVRPLYRGLPAGTLRVALALKRFDAFADKHPVEAHTLLDIYASNQRDALIDGDHLICLVQSSEPGFQLAPVGAVKPHWNRDEWLDRDRGI